MAFLADVSPAVVFVLLLRQTSHTLTCRPHHLHTCRSSSSSRVVRLLRCTFHRLPYSPAWIFIPSTFTFIQSHHSRPKHSIMSSHAESLTLHTLSASLSLSEAPTHLCSPYTRHMPHHSCTHLHTPTHVSPWTSHIFTSASSSYHLSTLL